MVRTKEAQIVLDGKTWLIVEGTFRTIEVLKGEPPQDQKVRSLVYGQGNCTMPLSLDEPIDVGAAVHIWISRMLNGIYTPEHAEQHPYEPDPD